MEWQWLTPRDNALLLIGLSMLYIAWQMLKQLRSSSNTCTAPVATHQYTGEYDDSGRYTGQGLLRASNGDTYDGSFDSGVFSGHGKYNFARTSPYPSSYVGQFVGGLFEGEGIEKYGDGSIYQGHFQQGKRHGKGKMTYFAAKPLSSHASFVGEWEAGNKASGCYTYADSSCFIGEFKNGKRHGTGVVVDKHGVKKRGEWKDGQQVGELKIVEGQPNGNASKTNAAPQVQTTTTEAPVQAADKTAPALQTNGGSTISSAADTTASALNGELSNLKQSINVTAS